MYSVEYQYQYDSNSNTLILISFSSPINLFVLLSFDTGGVTRAHFLSALFVRVILQRPNISSFREILANCTIVLASIQIQGAPELKNRFLSPSFEFHAALTLSVGKIFSLRILNQDSYFPRLLSLFSVKKLDNSLVEYIEIDASCYGNFISLPVAAVIFSYWYTEVIGLSTVSECAIGNGRLRGATNC